MRILLLVLGLLAFTPTLSANPSTTPPEVPCYNADGSLIDSNVPIVDCKIHHM
ncbi:hypothetical protein [Vibrio agarivorans]|uniref:hypothetical protein n=1 Tax=Vibrio agarivorans TaxID=153622 RepID=UPI00222F838F|nr:hypothetical protein [Vibrio agarivorans]